MIAFFLNKVLNIRRMPKAICVSFLLISCSLISSMPDGYHEKYIGTFKYGLFVPANYNPEQQYHLMLFLHGYSDTTTHEFSWYSKEFQAQYPTIVLTPKCPVYYIDGWGDSWHTEDTYAMIQVFKTIDSTRKYYNIDSTRMHILGISMGAFGTFRILATRPGMFASAIAICGGGNPATAKEVAKTPLWIFHGSDDDVVGVHYSRDIYTAILDSGGTLIRYTEYPGVKHNAWESYALEKSRVPWLFSQQLGSEHTMPDSIASFMVALNFIGRPGLHWTAPQENSQGLDDRSVWCYRIYRNNELIATVNDNIRDYYDMNAKHGNSYSYTVKSMNYFFKESMPAKELTIYINE
jgi:predicted esterase